MRASAKPQVAPSALQRELGEFSKQLKRLGNCLLNRTFELTIKGSRRRARMLLLLLPVLAFFFSLFTYSLAQWAGQFSRLLQYLLVSSFAQANPGAFMEFLGFVWQAFFGPQTLRYLPVVVLPFILALQAAANYLDDIFELGRVDIAREFILQVALTGSHKHIRIGGGVVAQAHLDAPIYKIGGPGQVVVELDSVALFEKPDGRPHVIGPTVNGSATLEGFERLRQVIDLRDQYPNALQVTSRSLDGIPVSAVDVRMIFSIWRKNQPATAEHPHPFDPKAVETLVYGQKSRVTLGERCPSVPPEDWTVSGLGLIRGELSKFMSKRRLVEYLASIGTPEVQQARQRESEIRKAKDAVIPGEDAAETQSKLELPDFQPRHKISSLFGQFAREFTEKASKRGIELHWVGIGTWQPHKEIIPERHIEAWRLSSENLTRGTDDAIQELRQETRLQQIIRQIQDIPLARFKNSSDDKHEHRMQDLLVAYREQLIEAVELLRKSKKVVPGSIYQAIEYLDNILGYHWVH
jgi:hypothetical protein